MSKAKDLSRLADLAQLMLDHRLGHLRQSAEQLDHSRMQLAAINRATGNADLDPLTEARVGLGYERWADVRRAELNLVIARQSATWHEARGEAQAALGRVQALQGLVEQVKARR